MVHPATFSHRIRVNLGHSCSPAHTTVDQPVRAHKPFVPSFLRYLAIMSSEPAVKFLLGIPDEGAINFVVRISNVFCRRGPHYDLLLIIGPAPVGQWSFVLLVPGGTINAGTARWRYVARALMLWILLGASEMIRFRYFFQVQAACPTRDKRHTLLLLPLVRRD